MNNEFAERKNKFIHTAAIRDIYIIYHEFLDYDESDIKEKNCITGYCETRFIQQMFDVWNYVIAIFRIV